MRHEEYFQFDIVTELKFCIEHMNESREEARAGNDF